MNHPWSKAIVAMCCFVFVTLVSCAQNFEKEGLQFTAAVRYSYDEKESPAGLYPIVTVHAFNCFLLQSKGINYKGKTYYPGDFNSQLEPFFNAVKVVTMSIRFEIDGTACDHTTSIDGTWRMGETKGNALCGISKKRKASVLNVIVRGPQQIDGVRALKNKIDELVKKEADDKKKTAVDQLLQDADRFLQTQQYAQAISSYNEALQTDPGNSTAATGKKNALEQQNAAELQKKKRETIKQLYTQADALFANGQYAQAIARYNQVLQLNPGETVATSGKQRAEKELEKKTTGQKKENNQSTVNNNVQETKEKSDSSIAAHKKYMNEKWRQDSLFIQEQWKQKQKDKQQHQRLYGELTDNYEEKLNNAFNRAEQQFESLSPEEQRRRCEQAEGYASNAALMIEMQEYSSASKLFQQAALLCPSNAKAFVWVSNSVVDFNSSLHKNEWDKEKQQQIAYQKQNLQFLEITTNYSSSQVNSVYNKFQIEQGYRQLYNRAKQDADRYYNLFSKISNVNIKFTDPATLNNFINARIKAIDANFNKAMNAAGAKAGAEYNQTYAQTGSTKTATGVAAVTGGADVIGNAIIAQGAKKQLQREREQQLNEIASEFITKLFENCNASLYRMLAAKTATEDSKTFSDFIYNYRRLQYACTNFSYSTTNWYYHTNFPANQGTAILNQINYLNKADVNLSAAQRKIAFFQQQKNYQPVSCNSINVYVGGWEVYSYRFLDEARAYLSNAVRINPANADAYYLLASIEPNDPRHYSYAFTAAQYAGNSGKSHFAGYAAAKQRALKNYLFQLVEKNQPENLSNWNAVINYRLHNQLSSTDISTLISKLISEERTDFLQALLRLDKAYTDPAVLQAMAMDAIRLNKGNTAAVLKNYLPVTKLLSVQNTQLNLLQLCIIENKPLAFAGFCSTSSNYQTIAAGMKTFEGSYPQDHLFDCFVAAALRYNSISPLEYIHTTNAGYFTAHSEIAANAVAMKGKTNVLSWLSEKQYINSDVLSEQLFNVSLYNDLAHLLQLGVNTKVALPATGAGVLQHQLQRLYETIGGVPETKTTPNTGQLISKAQQSQLWNRYVQLLLQHNTPVTIVTRNNSTALHTAAQLGDVQVMKRLLKALENENTKTRENLLNLQNSDGETALHVAIKNNYQAVAALLLNAGAGTFMKNKAGVSAGQLAKTMNVDLVNLNSMDKRDWLNVALEEDHLLATRLNKRGPVESFLSIVPVPEPNSTCYNDFQAFQQKTFNSALEVQTSGYLRSAQFTNAMKYSIKGKFLSNSNGGVMWMIDQEDEIKVMTLAGISQKGNELTLSFLISMEGVAGTATTLDADLTIRLYYSTTSKKLLITNAANEYLPASNIQLRKKIKQGETAVFYYPRLFLNRTGKLQQTAYYTGYSSKTVKNDVLYNHFAKDVDVQTYKDLTIRNSPIFVFVENKGKETITVTAFWK